MMNGQQLYEYYAQLQLNYRCQVDTYAELNAKDKAVWEQLASVLSKY